MREFKFRSWHKTAKNMLCDDFLGDCFRWFNEGQPIEIMQFTGLTDINGKPIFEGDIVSYTQHPGYSMSSFKAPVVWFESHACFAMSAWHTMFFPEFSEIEKDILPFLEVIGNIYQNPELIK